MGYAWKFVPPVASALMSAYPASSAASPDRVLLCHEERVATSTNVFLDSEVLWEPSDRVYYVFLGPEEKDFRGTFEELYCPLEHAPRTEVRRTNVLILCTRDNPVGTSWHWQILIDRYTLEFSSNHNLWNESERSYRKGRGICEFLDKKF